MQNKVNTWPGWNGNTRYPRLRSAAGWWPVTVVYRGCSPRVKSGLPWLVRGETRRCRAVSILYQYEIQTDGLGVKGTKRADAYRAVRFCAPFPVTKETERALESSRDMVWIGKNVKSRDRMLNDKEISVLQLLIWLIVTAMSNYYSIHVKLLCRLASICIFSYYSSFHYAI